LKGEQLQYAVGVRSPSIRKIHDKRFTVLAGPGRYIDPEIVSKDKDELVSLSSGVRVLTNKVVAHRSRKGPGQLPTYKELHQRVDQIVALYKKYNLLLRAKDYDPRGLGLPADWKDVFRQPWISREQTESA
jgi:hypothetical protein